MNKREATAKENKKIRELYLKMEPTPGNTMECVDELARQFGRTDKSVRASLSRAGVYVRVSYKNSKGTYAETKQNSKSKLIKLIQDNDLTLDEQIINKFTKEELDYIYEIIREV